MVAAPSLLVTEGGPLRHGRINSGPRSSFLSPAGSSGQFGSVIKGYSRTLAKLWNQVSGHDPEVLKELRTTPDLAPRATKVMARSLGRAMSTLVVQERHLWLCLIDIGTPTKFGSSRFLYPRLASSATQLVTWSSSFRLHRSRLRRSNTSCLGGQLLPPPVRRLQRPACSSPRAAPCVMDGSTPDPAHPSSHQLAAVGGSGASSKATHAPLPNYGTR